jgi:rod shape determining protein RodA
MTLVLPTYAEEGRDSFRGRLSQIEWGLVAVLACIALTGATLLYGAAGGSWQPWSLNHLIRFAVFLSMMLLVATVDVRVWYTLAYPAYGLSVVMLVAVEAFGKVAMGAQRWLEVGPIQIQPSEFMKIALAMALARFYHDSQAVRLDRIGAHVIPLAMVAMPAALIMAQPDLGTALMVVGVGTAMVIMAGLSWWYVAGAGAVGIGGATLGFFFVMHDFQKERILNFLDPSRDPLGTGYHITQSKIAIGSGGLFGVGFMQGTQSQLDFLPERHTDFILAMLLEEFGMVGGLFVLGLYLVALVYGVLIARACNHLFGKFMTGGITMLLFIYVAINAGMVVGILPVVGEALPLLSHGGSVMMSILFGIGLIQNARVFRGRTLTTGFVTRPRAAGGAA